MLEISWEFIPLILLVISFILYFVSNRFSLDGFESEGGMLFGFIFAILLYVNFFFYGIWGLIWVICHIKIV